MSPRMEGLADVESGTGGSRLDSRRILITGATGGLGRATAIAVANLGATVIAVGRDSGRLAATLECLKGTDHTCFTLDLEDSDQIPTAIKAISNPLDGVVHLAGADETKPLSVSSAEHFERLYRLNVVSAAMLCKSLTLPGVAAKRGCSVVVVGSVMSVVGSPARAAYGASKAAVLGLVRSAALELARKKIRVNALLPGYIETDMTRKQTGLLTPEQLEGIRQMHPMGLGRPEDVANACAFLLSDSARWITGTSLIVDGGYTAH